MKDEIITQEAEVNRTSLHHNPPFDVEKIRCDFPILKTVIKGKPLVYLDNAATSQKPFTVIDTVKDYYTSLNSNIHRGVHFLSEQSTFAYEEARLKIKEYINAISACEVIFTRGATEAINLVAYSYGKKFINPGDEIIISAMEHHANIVPWQILCEDRGAVLKVIPVNDEGELILEEYERLITGRTKLVSVVQVSNTLGTINPVEEIVRIAHKHDIPVLIDGSQAIAHERVDVQKLGCDFYVFSGHKVFGPTGIGVLYGKAELLQQMPPYQTGGDMIRLVSFEKTLFNDIPNKFEAGTPNIAGTIGLGVAIDYLNHLDFEGVRRHEQKLLDYATQKLSEIEGLRIIGTAAHKTSVISFVLNNVHPHDIGTILDSEAIAIRTGHHCTQPLMTRYCVPATARASFSFYNTMEEVDKLTDAIIKVIKVFS